MKRWLSRLGGFALFAAVFSPLAMAANAIDVYRDPSCGCCGAWISYLRTQGYAVTVHEDQAMTAVKTRLGVPADATSCHTALIGGYVIEGHVPVEDIRRLLAEHPDARGLAAPGMPIGSPGMEMGAPEHYDVVLIGRDGSSRVFASHGPKA
ncbi:DUF411 domain-containing protein [Rhodanobacter sp. UC4436_H3]